MEITAIKRVTT